MMLTFLKISLCLKYDIDLSPRASRSTLGWPISSSQCTLWQNFHPPILQLNCLIKHSPFAPTVGYLLSQQKCKGHAIFRIWTFKHAIISMSSFNINHNQKDASLTTSYYKTRFTHPSLPSESEKLRITKTDMSSYMTYLPSGVSELLLANVFALWWFYECRFYLIRVNTT